MTPTREASQVSQPDDEVQGINKRPEDLLKPDSEGEHVILDPLISWGHVSREGNSPAGEKLGDCTITKRVVRVLHAVLCGIARHIQRLSRKIERSYWESLAE